MREGSIGGEFKEQDGQVTEGFGVSMVTLALTLSELGVLEGFGQGILSQ